MAFKWRRRRSSCAQQKDNDILWAPMHFPHKSNHQFVKETQLFFLNPKKGYNLIPSIVLVLHNIRYIDCVCVCAWVLIIYIENTPLINRKLKMLNCSTANYYYIESSMVFSCACYDCLIYTYVAHDGRAFYIFGALTGKTRFNYSESPPFV